MSNIYNCITFYEIEFSTFSIKRIKTSMIRNFSEIGSFVIIGIPT